MGFEPLMAIRELAELGGASWDWAQVHVERRADGWLLRHSADPGRDLATLRPLGLDELHDWADVAEGGAFRPLRSAPSLRAGWSCPVSDLGALETALDRLYPGSVADWWALRQDPDVGTTFREYVGRQTGIYRGAQKLGESAAMAAIRACCHARFCSKRRMWRVDSMGADAPETKSRIPCLEPCAVALEMARRAAKLDSGPVVNLAIPQDELATLVAALEQAAGRREEAVREGDLGAATNPRRFQLLLERIRPEWVSIAGASAE